MLPKLDPAGIAYGAIMFCSSLLNNIFISYYIDLFVNVVHVDSSWFYIGQTVFMVWNAANDPLLGWLSDTTSCHERLIGYIRCVVSRFVDLVYRLVVAACGIFSLPIFRVVHRFTIKSGSQTLGCSAGDVQLMHKPSSGWGRRVDMIRFGGILWCVSFILLWWPWATLPSNSDFISSESPLFPRWVSALLSGLHFTGSKRLRCSVCELFFDAFPNIHDSRFAVTLCLYDGFLTYTEVNHTALLAEMTVDVVSVMFLGVTGVAMSSIVLMMYMLKYCTHHMSPPLFRSLS